ncbi:hypothetical protein [Leptolyngbya sp. FACHB-261]|uniref:hypothetical protein n=1 Tax=Leptolyngbya sp. FACHB-261 TaxID=2692806 RepID=UPI0016860D49|nr:hypothetical protein [Leptolyngbya sp. FACHB-261]MBD2101566.1 hypothetical protein [Leptolyngbya sp. FACHB-261]
MPTPTGESGSVAGPDVAPSQADLLEEGSLLKIFRLIDSILPFEACLYYQLVPIDLAGSHLKLAMVNPEDQTAWSYVRRTLAFLNCVLVPQELTEADHRTLLTRYLNRAKVPGTPAANEHPGSPTQSQANDLQSTLVLQDREQDLIQPEAQPEAQPEPASKQTPAPQPKEANSQLPISKTTIPQSLSSEVEVLQLQVRHAAESLQNLLYLPASELTQELLGRVLAQGIGRLYFERQEDRGRILWSQDGVLQSVLDNIPIKTIQGLINELKLLTGQAPNPSQKLLQTEVERQYGNEYLLLRLRVMPRSKGEEATLQVLRGAALKFYQQQQILTLSRDALADAHQLQRKISEIRSRLRHCPGLSPAQIDALPILGKLLTLTTQQLEHLDQSESSEA